MEKNYDIMQAALQQLPTYQMPDKNWDIVEHSLDIDVRNLPNSKIPRDIWIEIEASLNEVKLQLPDLQIPVDIWDKIEQDLEVMEGNSYLRISKQEKKSKFSLTMKAVTIAASLFLLFGLGKYFLFNNIQQEMLAFDGTTLQSMQFEDGSIIYSKQKAKVNYPKKFAKNSREVIQTSGIAFYEITKNPKRPFIIHSEIATVTVLGTSFITNVSADSIEVVVKTGKVSVASAAKSVTLLPTQSIIYYADGRKPKLMNIQTNKKLYNYDTTNNFFNF